MVSHAQFDKESIEGGKQVDGFQRKLENTVGGHCWQGVAASLRVDPLLCRSDRIEWKLTTSRAVVNTLCVTANCRFFFFCQHVYLACVSDIAWCRGNVFQKDNYDRCCSWLCFRGGHKNFDRLCKPLKGHFSSSTFRSCKEKPPVSEWRTPARNITTVNLVYVLLIDANGSSRNLCKRACAECLRLVSPSELVDLHVCHSLLSVCRRFVSHYPFSVLCRPVKFGLTCRVLMHYDFCCFVFSSNTSPWSLHHLTGSFYFCFLCLWAVLLCFPFLHCALFCQNMNSNNLFFFPGVVSKVRTYRYDQ